MKYSFVIEDKSNGSIVDSSPLNNQIDNSNTNKDTNKALTIANNPNFNPDSTSAKNQDCIQYLEKVKNRNKMSYLIISITFGISSLSDLAVQFFLKDVINLGPAELAQIMSMVMIPWFLKPFFGLITDLLPVCGYRRKFYIIFLGIIDFLCMMSMSFIEKSLTAFVLLLFIHNVCISFQTVLGEAIVVELTKLSKEEDKINGLGESKTKQTSKAKNYVAYFFFAKNLGVLFSSIFKGVLVKHFKLHTVFFMCSFISLLFVISGFILVKFIKAEDTDKNKNNISTNEVSNVNDTIGLLGQASKVEASKTTDTNANNISNLNQNNTTPPSSDESCPAVFFGFLFQKHIIIPIVFIIFFMGTPNYSDALFYYMTEELKFDSIFLGIISLFATIANLLGIVAYRYYFKSKTFRQIVVYGSIISFIVSFSSYLLVIRYNIKIGIPDFLYICCVNIFSTLVNEVVSMPLLSLAAVLSPKDLEGTAYAVFMSAINFGVILSGLLGSFVTSWLGITKTNFSNLPELIIICNFISILPLPLLFCINKSYFDPQPAKQEKLNEDSTFDTDNKVRMDGTGGDAESHHSRVNLEHNRIEVEAKEGEESIIIKN